MDTRSLLDNPPLNTALKIICYLRGTNIRLTAKNVLFLQVEYSWKNKVVLPTTSLKDTRHNLWDSATTDQKRIFESIARTVNLIDEGNKRRYFRRYRHADLF